MRFFSFIQRQGQILRWFRVWLSRLFVWFTVKISLICLCTRPGFIWCFLPEFLEGKVRNLDAHFTVTVIYRQEDKAPWMLQTEDTSVCLHDLFWRQCRGGQKCMSRVRRSLWITFLRIKPHSAHGSASQAPGVRAIRNFLHTSGCAWLLCCLCSPTACALGMSRWECCHSHPPAKPAELSEDHLLLVPLYLSLPIYTVKEQVKFKDVGLCFGLVFNTSRCTSYKYGFFMARNSPCP